MITWGLVLVMLLGAGVAMALATRRTRRVRKWALEQGLSETTTLLPILAGPFARPRVVVGYSSADVYVARLKTATTPASRSPNSPANWHVLAIRTPANSPHFTALRPVRQRVSLVDLFGVGYSATYQLLSFPSVDAADEFVVFGTQGADIAAIVQLSKSRQLPADLTLLTGQDWLILDFSSRPFSREELGGLLKLARTLAGSLAGQPSALPRA